MVKRITGHGVAFAWVAPTDARPGRTLPDGTVISAVPARARGIRLSGALVVVAGKRADDRDSITLRGDAARAAFVAMGVPALATRIPDAGMPTGKPDEECIAQAAALAKYLAGPVSFVLDTSTGQVDPLAADSL